MKELVEKRIALGWLLIALIMTPAVGILVWLLIIKAPPGNAILIGESPPEAAIATPSTGPTTVATTAAFLFTQQTAQVDLVSTSIPAGTGETAIAATSQPTQAPAAPTVETIIVYVSGAVNTPGVYVLPLGSRIGDAVSMAGGAKADADMEQINLAARLADEDHVEVPARGMTAVRATTTPLHPAARATQVPTAKATPNRPAEKVNLNTASAEELEGLPGIGPALAQRIIAYRTANGDFKKIEDVMQVAGIKEALFARLKSFVTVGP